MNNKVNYSLVGFLIICAIFLMLGFGYWLLKPSKDIEMRTYAIYFEESVLGLNIDASVKFKGINVGKVASLSINPKNSEEIIVLVSILKSTPVKLSTMAQLTSQGITGLSYINLTQGEDDSPLLKAEKGDEFPVIKTLPSLFSKLENTFGDVSLNLSAALEGTKQLLNKDNQKEVASLLKESSMLMHKFNKALDEETISNFQLSMKNLNSSLEKLDEIMPHINQFVNNSIVWENKISASFDSIKNSYLGIESSIQTFQKAIANDEFNLKDISSDVIPTINNTFLDMQNLIIKTQELLNRQERSPSDIIFMQEEIKKGPGEK